MTPLVRIRVLAAVALFALAADGLIAYWNINALIATERSLTSSHTRLNALESAVSMIKDAESGQRGFLLTGDEEYLAPYNEAIAGLDGSLTRLRTEWPDTSAPLIDELIALVRAKRAEMQQTIDLRRDGRLTAAESVVRRGRGQKQMNDVREVAGHLRNQEAQRLAAAGELSAASRRTALATAAFAGVVALAAVLACLWLVRRDLMQNAAVAQERAQLLQREQEARAAAEKANHLKDEFLAKLSHELRNPLHAIVGWLQILQQRPDDAALRERGIDTVERNARALQRMIEDLLDLSRAASGKLEIRHAPTPIGPIVTAVIETMRPSAAVRGVALEEHRTSQPTQVAGDHDRLAQVVINLVSNAIKFTPSGGRVSVDVSREPAMVVMSVSDTGRGISPDARDQIFEAFRQAGPKVAGPEGGLGLGLTIARQIIELHGGTIDVFSEGIGSGSRFTVRLPAVEGEWVGETPDVRDVIAQRAG
jgi:signal transduction histidine kinase